MGIVTAGGAAMAAGMAAVAVAAPDPGDAEDVTGAAVDDALADAEIATGTVAEGVVVDATAKGSPVNTPVVVEACEADEESSAPGDATMGAARADERLRGAAMTVDRARMELLMT